MHTALRIGLITGTCLIFPVTGWAANTARICGTAILPDGASLSAGELKVLMETLPIDDRFQAITQSLPVDPVTHTYCGDNAYTADHEVMMAAVYHDNSTGTEKTLWSERLYVRDASGAVTFHLTDQSFIFDFAYDPSSSAKLAFYGVNDYAEDKDLPEVFPGTPAHRMRYQPYSAYYNRIVSSGFGNGNLISNGSFEVNSVEGQPEDWGLGTGSGGWDDNGLGGKKWVNYSVAPITGTEVLAISYDATGQSSKAPQATATPFRLLPSTEYILSFYYRNINKVGSFSPNLFISNAGPNENDLIQNSITLPTYSSSGTWTLYSCKFTTGTEATWGELSLLKTTFGTSGTFVFDDVLLEPSATALTPQGSQSGVQKAISYFNGMNKLVQTLKYDRDRDIVSAPDYDELGRQIKSSLPVGADLLGVTGRHAINEKFLGASAKGNLDWFYTDPTSGGPQSGGYAYLETFYENSALGRVLKTINPGLAWRTANKTIEKTYVSTDGLNPGGNDEAPSPATHPLYFYTLTKGEEGLKTREFTDMFGQKVKIGTKIGASWADATYKYDGLGNVIEENSPNGQDGPIQSTATYNSLSEKSHDYSPDRGETSVLYDKLGQVRFTQNEMQRQLYQYTYMKYDALGRMIESGVVQYEAFSQENADNPDFPSYQYHQARVYNFYDEKPSLRAYCEDPSGVPIYISRSDPSPINPHEFSDISSAYERLKAQIYDYWNFNGTAIIYQVFDSPTQLVYPTPGSLFLPISRQGPTVPLSIKGVLRGSQEYNELVGPSVSLDLDWGPLKGRLVSTLVCNTELQGTPAGVKPIYKVFNYDKYGNISDFLEYNGYVSNASKRLQLTKQKYDPSNRVIRKDVFPDAASATPEVYFTYSYDHLGRLDEVRDYSGSVVAKHTYDLLGRLKQVDLGRGNSPLSVFYTYNFRGWLKEIRASSTTRGEIWSQQLRYEDANTANGEVPRYDGDVVAYNYKLMGMAQQLYKFEYDDANRLHKASTTMSADLKPGSASAFLYDYFDNGSIETLTRGEDAFNYRYQSGTNQLDRVEFTGSFPRPMGARGTFAYDPAGRMYQDSSKRMTIDYDDFMDRPIQFASGGNAGVTQTFMAYDESGNRVSKFTVLNGSMNEAKHYFSQKEVREFPTTAQLKEFYKFDTYGRITYNASGGKEYEINLKNHLGSTMEVFNTTSDNLGYKADYEPYGRLRSEVQSTDELSEKFTGKENDAENGLDYFGARYYDAELGVWISPDPCRQHFSPYLYASDNPIGRVDPNGCADVPKIIKGAGQMGSGAGLAGTGAVVAGIGVASSEAGVGWGLIYGGGVLGLIGTHTFMTGWANFLNGFTDTKNKSMPEYTTAKDGLVAMLPPGAQDAFNAADFVMTGKGVMEKSIPDILDMSETATDGLLSITIEAPPTPAVRDVAPSDATKTR
jgi:RHS repeat-associated protein